MSVVLMVAGLALVLGIVVLSNVAVSRVNKDISPAYGRFDDALLRFAEIALMVGSLVFLSGVLLDVVA